MSLRADLAAGFQPGDRAFANVDAAQGGYARKGGSCAWMPARASPRVNRLGAWAAATQIALQPELYSRNPSRGKVPLSRSRQAAPSEL